MTDCNYLTFQSMLNHKKEKRIYYTQIKSQACADKPAV
jgi:hypothetical protein